MRRAVFLDRDGTINVDKGYVHRIEDFKFIPGSLDALRRLQDLGFALVIISNQSGIARGFYGSDEYHRLTDWMLAEMREYGIQIGGVYHCPHHPKGVVPEYSFACDCRKPSTGLFARAASDLGLDIDRSWAIGDRLRDLSVCVGTGCRGLLVGSSEAREALDEVDRGAVRNVQRVRDLSEAANHIAACASRERG